MAALASLALQSANKLFQKGNLENLSIENIENLLAHLSGNTSGMSRSSSDWLN